MIKFRVMNGVLIAFGNQAQAWVNAQPNGEFVTLKPVNTDTGTVSMLRTWRGWMAEVAYYMANRGARMPLVIDEKGEHHGSRPFNAQDAHECFTMYFLGADEHGTRYSWAMSSDGGQKVAPKSKRLYAMDKMVAYCAERGIPITIPEKSEYMDAEREQEG